ncbi:enterochelin esterase domain-containing protein [Marinomonas algicola]|uniref:enterochelin esterase domain-containing protein n=1 Tax=Marinomonas algicola TaxID=2773454 RepID=UPI00174D0B94|nr:enterochelin esterase domain-containing protein [Marinomonas algicola]
MTTAKRLMHVLCASWLFSSSQYSQANEGALSLTNNIKGVLSTEVDVPLNVAVGDYIEGQIVISNGEVNLGLHEIEQTEKNKMRLLLESVASGDQFRFVANEATQSLRLISLVPEDGEIEYSLSITKQIPVVDQHPPIRTYLSPTIKTLVAKIQKKQSITTLWDGIVNQGTPLIEPLVSSQDIDPALPHADKVIMTFLYRGAKHNVRLFGAPSNQHEFLENLVGTDIWFKSFVVPSTTRLSYKLAPDIPEFSGSPWGEKSCVIG